MKVESTTTSHMLYKGVTENSDKFTKSKEVERQKAAVEKETGVSSFLENKGIYFDAKV